MARKANGFTLIEAVIGSLILAVGAVVICGLARRCLDDNAHGAQYEQAWRLLDETLDKVAALGVGKEAAKGTTEGDFADRFGGYKYKLQIKPTASSGLYQVNAQISWRSATQEYIVQTTALIYDLP
jgi:hypothetical protein